MLKVSRILKSAIETRDELVQALGKIMNSDPRIQDLKRLNNRRVIDMYDEGPGQLMRLLINFSLNTSRMKLFPGWIHSLVTLTMTQTSAEHCITLW